MSTRRRKVDQNPTATHDAMAVGREMLDAARALDNVALLANIIALESALDAARAGEPGIDVDAIAADVRRLSERAAPGTADADGPVRQPAGARRGRRVAGRSDALRDFGVLVRQLTNLADGLTSNESSPLEHRRRPARRRRGRD